jgi:hypothetical protein
MAEIDYHIEISTLVEFINDQIKSSTLIPISGAEIFKHIRRAVLDAEIKPFLYSSEKEDKKNYYQKYVRLKSEFDERYVPDFFEREEKLLSPAQTCLLFEPKISKTTLSTWTKQGLINEHRIGRNVYYKQSEILEKSKVLRRYKN